MDFFYVFFLCFFGRQPGYPLKCPLAAKELVSVSVRGLASEKASLRRPTSSILPPAVHNRSYLPKGLLRSLSQTTTEIQIPTTQNIDTTANLVETGSRKSEAGVVDA